MHNVDVIREEAYFSSEYTVDIGQLKHVVPHEVAVHGHRFSRNLACFLDPINIVSKVCYWERSVVRDVPVDIGFVKGIRSQKKCVQYLPATRQSCKSIQQ